jgi:hypothetical protein
MAGSMYSSLSNLFEAIKLETVIYSVSLSGYAVLSQGIKKILLPIYNEQHCKKRNSITDRKMDTTMPL